MPAIETVSGVYVDPENPDPETLLINDMAWALSRTARFAGATITPVAYNNAQHSVFVASMIEKHINSVPIRLDKKSERDLILFGLLHDCAECYVGDVPSPIKRIPKLRTVFSEIEDKLLNIIFNKYVGHIPSEEEWHTVKYYDARACQIEAFVFMRSRGLTPQWGPRQNIDLVELQSFSQPEQSVESYQKFIAKFSELSDDYLT